MSRGPNRLVNYKTGRGGDYLKRLGGGLGESLRSISILTGVNNIKGVSFGAGLGRR